jgi:hypothetical protein
VQRGLGGGPEEDPAGAASAAAADGDQVARRLPGDAVQRGRDVAVVRRHVLHARAVGEQRAGALQPRVAEHGLGLGAAVVGDVGDDQRGLRAGEEDGEPQRGARLRRAVEADQDAVEHADAPRAAVIAPP